MPTTPQVPHHLFWADGAVPAWADEWGTDEFGPWAAFRLPGLGSALVTQRVRWAPSGYFIMGSPKGEAGRFEDEGPEHVVTFKQGFWIFETACTEALWLSVTRKISDPRRSSEFPVTNVSWDEAQNFISALNNLRPGFLLTLPSEAHWEYACRAGTTTPYHFGSDITPQLARYDFDSPAPVASFPANDWGLREMHGNVSEWCLDSWHDDYVGAPADGSAWGGVGQDRVYRGASFRGAARDVRSAYRRRAAAVTGRADLGFRCARVQETRGAPAWRAGNGKQAARSDAAAGSSPPYWRDA